QSGFDDLLACHNGHFTPGSGSADSPASGRGPTSSALDVAFSRAAGCVTSWLFFNLSIVTWGVNRGHVELALAEHLLNVAGVGASGEHQGGRPPPRGTAFTCETSAQPRVDRVPSLDSGRAPCDLPPLFAEKEKGRRFFLWPQQPGHLAPALQA